jgi:hypothetical protein
MNEGYRKFSHPFLPLPHYYCKPCSTELMGVKRHLGSHFDLQPILMPRGGLKVEVKPFHGVAEIDEELELDGLETQKPLGYLV